MAEIDVQWEFFDSDLYRMMVNETQDRIERQFLQLEIPRHILHGPIYINFGEDVMTEQEWLMSNDARKMFNWLTHIWPSGERLVGVTDRKLRLFAIAHCRKYLCDYDYQEFTRHLLIVENMADNNIPPDPSSPYWISHDTPLEVARHTASITYSKVIEEYNANLLREIFGNPWVELNRYSWHKNLTSIRRADFIDFRHEWTTLNDGIVGKMAETIYKDRDWASLPILADALEDVGCNSPAILAHFRSAEVEHVRGCWALDLVLAKDKDYARSSRLQKQS